MLTYLRIGALVAFLAVVAMMLFYRGQAIQADAERDKAVANLSTAIAANKAQEETIGRLRADAVRNDRIVAKLADDIATVNQALSETNESISTLRDANEDVRTYLGLAVPADLRRLLDR